MNVLLILAGFNSFPSKEQKRPSKEEAKRVAKDKKIEAKTANPKDEKKKESMDWFDESCIWVCSIYLQTFGASPIEARISGTRVRQLQGSIFCFGVYRAHAVCVGACRFWMCVLVRIFYILLLVWAIRILRRVRKSAAWPRRKGMKHANWPVLYCTWCLQYVGHLERLQSKDSHMTC